APVLVAGLLLVPRAHARERETSMLITVAAIGALGVFATQYHIGIWEWGARFLAITVPPVAALAAIGWNHAHQALPTADARALRAAGVGAVLAFALLLTVAHRAGRLSVQELQETIVAEATQGTV